MPRTLRDAGRWRSRLAFAYALASSAFATAALGDARVYRENPTRTPDLELLPLPEQPTSGQGVANEWLRVRSCLDRGEGRAVIGFELPAKLRVCSLEASAEPDASGDFAPEPRAAGSARTEADAFAEVSAYFHVTRMAAFVRGLAPNAACPGPAQLDVVVDARMPDADAAETGMLTALRGAFYVSPTPEESAPLRSAFGVEGALMLVGETPLRSLAYDGDVLAHETVHAALDCGLSAPVWRAAEHELRREPEALREAIADYLVAAATGNGVIGEYAFGDGVLGPPRNLDDDASVKVAIGGEPYAESIVYSGALWRARSAATSAAAATALDTAVFRVARDETLTRDASVSAFAARLGAELDSRGLAQLRARIEEELAHRHVDDQARVVALNAEQPLRSPTGVFIAPGKHAARATALAPGLFQVEVDLPEDARELEVRVDALARQRRVWGTDPGSSASLVVIVGWDAKVRWQDGVPSAETRALEDERARLSIPHGARVAYVQIGNAGDADGFFSSVEVSLGLHDTPLEQAGATAPPPAGCAIASPGVGRTPGPFGHTTLAWKLMAASVCLRASRRRKSRPRCTALDSA